MSKLELKSSTIQKAPSVTVVSVQGSLDLATLAQLESYLEGLKQQKRMKIVMDLAALDYISSSGLGSFLGMVDHFRQGGGDLVFVGLSPKIHRVFSVVGFLRLLTVLADVEAGLAHFEGPAGSIPRRFNLAATPASQHSGEAFLLNIEAVDESGQVVASYAGKAALKPGWGIVSPAQAGPFKQGRWSGPVILTGPGEVPLKAVDQGVEGEVRVSVTETQPLAQFPLTVSCPGCRRPLSVQSGDIFRCTECNEIFMVDRWGHAFSLRKGGGSSAPARSLQVNFPADVNILSNVRSFVTGILKEEGYGEEFINDVEMAADEAITNVVEHAYEYDASKTIGLRLTLEKKKLTLLIRDTGRAFDPASLPDVDLENHVKERKTGGLGRFLMKTLMDSVEYASGPDGNTLLMVKQVKP